jgi:PAS domain S-box-containing protein
MQDLTLEHPLSLDEFLRAFPFFFAWSEDGRIVRMGPSLDKVCAGIREGDKLDEVFAVERPQCRLDHGSLLHHREKLFLLRHQATGRILRGQVLIPADRKVGFMLASPWLTDPDEVASLGLTMGDFAVHDQTMDLLQLMQNQRMAMADLKRLTEKLTSQRSQLRQREAEARRLALVASRTVNAVILADASGAIEWVNDGFTRMTGWTLDEVKGKKPGDFLQGPQTDPETVAMIRRNLDRREGFRAEILNYSKDGRRYWVEIEIQPMFDDEGGLSGYIAVESDISDRRAAEQRRHLQYRVSKLLA